MTTELVYEIGPENIFKIGRGNSLVEIILPPIKKKSIVTSNSFEISATSYI